MRKLLIVVDEGGYSDFSALCREAGFEVETVRGMRKGISRFQIWRPDVVIAEFVFNPQFSFRVGNLESLLGALQRDGRGVRLILLVDRENQARLAMIENRYPVFGKLFHPLDRAELAAVIAGAARA